MDIDSSSAAGGIETSRAHVVIYGRVQGVSFRYHTLEEAGRRQLTGWVRNRPDGSVEAVFEGERAHIEQILEWCQTGPPAAHVTQVDLQWEAPEGTFSGFNLRF
jgi:acylphosphatase